MITEHMDSAEHIFEDVWVYVLDDVMMTELEAEAYLNSIGFTELDAVDYLFCLIAAEKVRQLRARNKGYADVPFNLAAVMALARVRVSYL